MKQQKAAYALLIFIILCTCGYFLIPEIARYFYEQQEEAYIKDRIVEIAPNQPIVFDAEKEEAEPYGTGADFNFTGSIEFQLDDIQVFNSGERFFSYPLNQVSFLPENTNPDDYNYVEMQCTIKNIDALSTMNNGAGEDCFNALFIGCYIQRPGYNIPVDTNYFDSSIVSDSDSKLWQLIKIPRGASKTFRIGFLAEKESGLDSLLISYGSSEHYKYRTYPAQYTQRG